MFIFGSQYLRGMTPVRADWDRDMTAMMDAGFNTIRAWLVWGVLEPRQGHIDFDYMQTFLDLASRHNLRVGMLFHLHGCPEWACVRYSEYWYVNAQGRAFEPSQRSNTPSGGWPGLCPDHGAVRQMEAAFIDAVVSRFGEHPAAAFWEPMNEPHMWIDHETEPPGIACYCSATQAAFRQWLRAKYGQIENLEQAWGRRFDGWETVRPPTWKFGFSDWADWRTFAAESIAGHVDRRAAIIRKHTKLPVIAHSWGGGCVTNVNLGAMAFDDWKNAASLDVWGYSAFPGRVEQAVMVGLGTDATRCAAGGKEFWQSELGAGDYGTGINRSGRIRAELQTLFCWESIRHGAKGLLFWQFRKEAHGSELGAFGLTDYAGRPTENLLAVARVGKALNDHSELFQTAKPPPSEVAILFSYRSFMADWSQHRRNRLSVDSLSGYYKIFWDENIPVDILHEEFTSIETLRRYRLVVLPMPVALASAIRPLLKQYVREGGWLLSDPYLCGFNADLSLATEVPGDGFADLFGCRELDITRSDKKPVGVVFDGQELEVTASHLRATWELLAGGQCLCEYASGGPAVVLRTHGQGGAVMSGLNLGLSASTAQGVGDDLMREGGCAHGQAALELVMAVVARAGVRPGISTPSDVRAGLLSTNDGRNVLIAVNIADAPRHGDIEVRSVRFSAAEDLLTGEPVKAGHSTVPVHLDPFGSAVLCLQ